MEVPPEVQDCVAFLGFDRTNKDDDEDAVEVEVCGTCFFVSRPSEVASKSGHLYLVTAKHVIDDVAHGGHNTVFVRVNMADGKVQWFGTKAAEWVTHPTDSVVDVAVFPFSQRVFVQTDQRVFPITAAATARDLAERGIGVGEELFFPGLFWRHYGKDRNLPIVRTGTIAAMPVEKLRVRDGLIDAYLVEARSIGGLSGSPVFVRMDGRKAREHWVRRLSTRSTPTYALLGLVRGHYDDGPADHLTRPDRKAEMVNMGIGIVVPIEKIAETIMHPELVDKYERVEQVLAEGDSATND